MPEAGGPTQEGAVEGRAGDWGEVVTRQPYRKVRLDHLLSKENGYEEVERLFDFECSNENLNTLKLLNLENRIANTT